MSRKIATTIFLCLLPVVCLSGVWQTYDNIYSNTNTRRIKLLYNEGFIWSVSGSGIWRFNPDTDEQNIIYPSDWSNAIGKICNQIITRNGEQWFFIDYVGIIQYDGINWRFHGLSSFPDSLHIPNAINSMAEDSYGRIWIETYQGLIYFDGSEWRLLDTINDTSLSKGSKVICSDNEGNLWLALVRRFGSQESEFLAKNDGNQWIIYPMPEGYSFCLDNLNFRICADNTGGIWFWGIDQEGGKIFRFFNGIFTPLREGAVNSFAAGKDGTVWIQGGLGIIYKINGEEWITYEPKTLFPEIASVDMGEIVSLPDGSLWILAFDYHTSIPVGFAVIRDGVLSRHDYTLSKFPCYPNNIALRNNHGVITDHATGIYEMKDIKNPSAVIPLLFDRSGSSTNYDVLIDSSDKIWCATGGLISFADGIPTNHHKESWWPPKGRAQALAEGIDGIMWVAMRTQLFSYKDDVGTEISLTDYKTCDNIAVDTSGVLWMARDMDGLSYYDGTEHTKVDIPGIVNDVSTDSKGGVWAAASNFSLDDQGSGGLYYIQDVNITRYSKENGLPGQQIFNVKVAPDDSVWFYYKFYTKLFDQKVYSGGVCHFDIDNPKLEIYRPEDGLASYDVSDIAVSSEGIVWFTTDAGLSTLDLNATPDPKIRTGVNKYNLNAGDEFKLGINIQNRGPQRTVKLLTALLYNDVILYFDFTSAQFTPNFSALPVTLPENLKFNTEIWKLQIPSGLEGKEIIFGSALLDVGSSEIIGKISIETINFIQ